MKVITPGETELFDITAGVTPGDILAPFLFIIVFNFALRTALEGREEELGFTINPIYKIFQGPQDHISWLTWISLMT